MAAQHTPRIMSKISIHHALFTGSFVNLLAVCCEMKVASGRHERIITFTERGKSEILKLLSAMFIVNDKENRMTATHSIIVLSFFGVYAHGVNCKMRMTMPKETKATICWSAVTMKADGMPFRPF